MFKVKPVHPKFTGEIITVYATVVVNGKTLFLIFTPKGWDWVESQYYFPAE